MKKHGIVMPESDEFLEPIYHLDLHHIWISFTQLSRSRPQYYGGAGALLFSEILSYFALHGYNDPEENRFFLQMIHELDIVFMKYENNQQAKNLKKAELDNKING